MFFMCVCKNVLPAYSCAKIIKIKWVFPELWSKMYCHVFYESRRTFMSLLPITLLLVYITSLVNLPPTTVLWPLYATTCVSEHTHTHNHFTALFPGLPGWANARRLLLDFMVQGEINRGRHTDHPVGRHSIRTNQCPPPPSPHFFTGRMPFLPPNQQCQNISQHP